MPHIPPLSNRSIKAKNEAIALARLEESVRAVLRQGEQLSAKMETLCAQQRHAEAQYREVPELKSELRKSKADITQIGRSLASIRWFFMGMGAAFGFLGGAASDALRSVVKLVLG